MSSYFCINFVIFHMNFLLHSIFCTRPLIFTIDLIELNLLALSRYFFQPCFRVLHTFLAFIYVSFILYTTFNKWKLPSLKALLEWPLFRVHHAYFKIWKFPQLFCVCPIFVNPFLLRIKSFERRSQAFYVVDRFPMQYPWYDVLSFL